MAQIPEKRDVHHAQYRGGGFPVGQGDHHVPQPGQDSGDDQNRSAATKAVVDQAGTGILPLREPDPRSLSVARHTEGRLSVLYGALVRIASGMSVIFVLVAFVALWEALCRFFDVPVFLLPAPSMIVAEFLTSPVYFLNQSVFTLGTTLAGFGLALLFGFILAIGIIYSKILEKTIYTLLVALNSIPKVAVAPLFVIWMGTGAEPKIAVALSIAIFAVVIDTVLGIRSADPDLLNLARSARASQWQVLFKIRLPGALPSIFAGMKVAMSLALVGAIVGEFVAGETGLGHAILLAQGMFQIPRMFVAIFILGILGTVLFYLVELCERIFVPWHVSQRVGNDGSR